MARGQQTELVKAAEERLRTRPAITISDYALIYDVSEGKAYADAAAGNIEGAFLVGGSLIRIASPPHRVRLCLTPPTSAELITEAA